MMTRIAALYCTMFLALLLPAAGRAQTPTCQGLTGEQKALATTLLTTLHPYACCDETIAECLKKDRVCALAHRLAERICKRVANGEDKKTITRGLSRRARSMMPSTRKAAIALDGVPVVGSEDAPVVVVEYACARCPFCTKITPPLHESIGSGALRGKARLYFKTFPIRGHTFSKEAGLGFVAASMQGKFWDYMLYAYQHFDSFCPLKQADWAETAGLDRKLFEQSIEDPAARSLLVASKKEGIVNKVGATPTFFINGRKFVGDLSLEELVDAIEEEHERLAGIEFIEHAGNQ